ncbi:putative 3,4-dihydroxy-2-butanone kinase [Acorus calamus]|uniref:3,4-dihydroxy-2-butanone kinase n=1 Tax=Acorus calamus TaxID=4465 RepID=A0AAV9EEJ9_ACOCL|nr:putative 3,4-dihydroxy-2-butanone kinase [Acorus calamus]
MTDVVTEFIEGMIETYSGLQYLEGFPRGDSCAHHVYTMYSDNDTSNTMKAYVSASRAIEETKTMPYVQDQRQQQCGPKAETLHLLSPWNPRSRQGTHEWE